MIKDGSITSGYPIKQLPGNLKSYNFTFIPECKITWTKKQIKKHHKLLIKNPNGSSIRLYVNGNFPDNFVFVEGEDRLLSAIYFSKHIGAKITSIWWNVNNLPDNELSFWRKQLIERRYYGLS